MADKDFEIKFSGLKLGTHKFDFQLDKSFFDLFDYSDLESSKLKAEIELEKKNNSLELQLKLDGSIKVPCDITNELFDLSIQNEFSLVVKFGEEFNDESEEILIIPFDSHSVNIAQYLYELAVLAIPLRKIHPDVEAGKKGQEILKKIEELSPENKGQDEDKETDPRWDKLKTLLN